MRSKAFNAALDAVCNMETRGPTQQRASPAIKIRPRGVPFEGYPPLSLSLLFENGGIIACPQNDWMRRWLRRS